MMPDERWCPGKPWVLSCMSDQTLLPSNPHPPTPHTHSHTNTLISKPHPLKLKPASYHLLRASRLTCGCVSHTHTHTHTHTQTDREEKQDHSPLIFCNNLR